MSTALPADLPADVAAFPFPLAHDTYRISANVEPVGDAPVLHAGDDHASVLDERARILAREPGRFVAAAHSRAACWDAARHLTGLLAAERPDEFTLDRDGDRHRWQDHRTGETGGFTFGDDASLGEHPLRFAGRRVEEDVVVLGARDGRLWLDAGLVTFASVWSIGFNAGMSFRELHGPVPGNGPGGVFERAERFLLRLEPGEAYRRLNWSLQADDRRDMSLDSWPDWMARRHDPRPADPGREIHMRVEVQHLIRLPLTGSLLFLIGIRLLPLERLALVPAWAARTVSVLETLPPEVAAYKELSTLGELTHDYLRATLV